MKKFCITFLLSGIIILTAVAFGGVSKTEGNADYLRIHIRADSNEEEAQRVKYLVRDDVVAYLTPIVAKADEKEEAMRLLEENLSGIEKTANAVLQREGFDYTCKALLTLAEFPTRKYGFYTLEKGVYDALILKLGSGKGDNWWCVVYPPLCFAGNENIEVRYKSLIAEKIEKWKKRQGKEGVDTR